MVIMCNRVLPFHKPSIYLVLRVDMSFQTLKCSNTLKHKAVYEYNNAILKKTAIQTFHLKRGTRLPSEKISQPAEVLF